MEHSVTQGGVVRQAFMKRYTSMKVGGPVPYLFYPRDEEDLRTAILWLRDRNLPVRFLGNGTNLIVADQGMAVGLVRITRMRCLRFLPRKGGVLVEAGGGLSLKALIKECSRRGYSGLEKLYGIPGTVGGAVKMNAGSFGVSVADHLASVRLIDTNGAVVTKARKEMNFAYRRSPVTTGQGVVTASFDLVSADPGQIAADMNLVWQQRLLKHPMDLPSAGSVFKNTHQLPSWKYVDLAGFRGARIGGAAISEKHSNFIVNTGNATAADIVGLIGAAKKGVRDVTGVSLEEEVELWGFDVYQG